MRRNANRIALSVIEEWERGEYLHPAQQKAALQILIRKAILSAMNEEAVSSETFERKEKKA